MTGNAEYLVAWAVYLGFAVLLVAQLFALTRARSFFAQVMIRGHFIVLAFTPAEIVAFPGHYAPAILTLAMDVLLKGAGSTLEGAMALLVAYLAMLVGVGVYRLVRGQQKAVKVAPADQSVG